MEAVRQKCWALRFASEELKRDREVVIEAVRQNGEAIRFASKQLQRDREVAMEAVRQDGSAPPLVLTPFVRSQVVPCRRGAHRADVSRGIVQQL